VVAIVGENGAGETTLAKLLAKMYEPTSCSIFVDETPLARVPAGGVAEAPRRCVSGLFPFRIPRPIYSRSRRRASTGRRARSGCGGGSRRAADVTRLIAGQETQLGLTWPGGVELSFGQWQKLALARGFMRDEPLLLILDEPTAALDAETEHALFERYAAAAHSRGENDSGRITILVSHRFSTVRMADLILVLTAPGSWKSAHTIS
jgi:ATP-binding cassette, subfamily B, bacterial